MRHASSTAAVRNLGVLALVLVTATSVQAFREGRPEARFDDFVVRRSGGVIANAPRALSTLDPTDGLRIGWEAFRQSHGERWQVHLDERSGMPTLVSGIGIEWFADDANAPGLEALEAEARSFLDAQSALLGDWSDVLELDRDASGEIRPGHWQLVFRQSVNGVRVENSRLELQVNRGRLTMFGASKWGPISRSGVSTLDADEARAELDAFLGVSTASFEQAAEPELALVAVAVIDPTVVGPSVWTGPRGAGLDHMLVWRLQFRVEDEPALWTAEVDAHDGTIRAFYDGAHYAAIRGGVFPISPDGDCAGGGCEIAEFPMPFADYTESGQLEAFADEYGNVACADPAATFETNLIGPYVEIDDVCGATVESGACGSGGDLGMKSGENCDVAPGASAGNTAAARSGYYQVNRIAEIARFFNPGNTWLNGRVVLNVNVEATCNATWGGEINMYRAGNGCGNTGEIQGVVVHEWGHGYDQNDGGGYDNTSEAYADVVAIFAARESCIGRGFFADGRTCSGYGDTCLTCTGIRDHDYAARAANIPATPQGFLQDNCATGSGPCGFQTHCAAYPIGESIFDLATRDLPAAGLDPATAWQTAERLWFETRQGSSGDIYTCALPASDSCAAGTWYQRMRAADDDDGDLSNGTPHAAALFAAFDRHNIACGLAGDPENQSTSSCPSLATPMLTVTETPAGTELSWTAVTDVAEYQIYRGELGCDRQQVPVATVLAGTTSWVDDVSDPGLPRRYRVEAIGANPACRSAVSNCEVAPNGPRLQRNAYRIVEQGANVNFNGFLDPGETAQLPVTLFNGGVADATGVTGRLRVADPDQGRVLDIEADWGTIAEGVELESSSPHFELTVFDGVQCGDSIGLELEMYAANAAPRITTFAIPFGNPDRDYVNADGISIPRETTTPVTSTIDVPEGRTITEVDVSIDINHLGPSELIVKLISPTGTEVTLHNLSGGFFGIDARYDLERNPDGPGTMDDFIGESTAGTWTLSIEDTTLGQFGNGTLVSWTLHFSVAEPFDCDVFTCAEPTPTQSPDGLTVEKSFDAGTGETDLVFAWNGVPGVAGYHVLQSTAAPFDGQVDLSGRTDGETTLTLDDGASSTPDVAFFLVRAVNACNQESP